MHWIRYFLFLLVAGEVAVQAWFYGVRIFMVYFTLWTMLFTLISVGLSIVVTSTEDIHVRLGLQAVHHMFYTAAIFMNFITMVVYWGAIHPECLVKFGGSDLDLALRCYLCHIIPGVVCLANSWLTNSKMSIKFLPGLLVFGLLYLVLNYFETKKAGKPVYHFLTWEGPDSLFIVAAMMAVFSILYFGLCWIDGWVKHESLTVLLERR